MFSNYVLDTNAFFFLLKHTDHPLYEQFKCLMFDGCAHCFYLPEISSMEIHSVLGKHVRSVVPSSMEKCGRSIFVDGEEKKCDHVWVRPQVKKIPKKLFRDIVKIIDDVVNKRGDLQAEIITLNSRSTSFAKHLLKTYADKYSFGSHDALIAGSLLELKETTGIDLTMVTSDKGLKAVLGEVGINIYDPINPCHRP